MVLVTGGWVILAFLAAACSSGFPAGLAPDLVSTRAPPETNQLRPSAGSPAPGTSSTATEPACVLRAAFVEDVTIHDDSDLAPGEPFAKVWRLRNDGTCAWDSAYGLSFVGGERMGALRSTPLNQTVLPGGSIDLTVEMVAPEQPGAYQGFWKLEDPQGRLFGVGAEGRLSFWVKIAVPAKPLADQTQPRDSPPDTDASTAPVVEILTHGTAALPPGFSFDLDLGQVQSKGGDDIQWRSSGGPSAELVALPPSLISRPMDRSSEEARPVCSPDGLAGDPVSAEDLPLESAVCYQTNQGRSGYLIVLEAAEALRFDYTTLVK